MYLGKRISSTNLIIIVQHDRLPILLFKLGNRISKKIACEVEVESMSSGIIRDNLLITYMMTFSFINVTLSIEELAYLFPKMGLVGSAIVGNLTPAEVSSFSFLLLKLDYYHNDIFLHHRNLSLEELQSKSQFLPEITH